MSSRRSLSLCMIVRDEEQNLARCLESVRGVVDEIIVVDTGSLDATREIARSFGADVHEMVWPNDFSVARNVSIERATGDVVLVLAADEEVDAGSREAMRTAVDTTTAQGLRVRVRNLMPPGEVSAFQDDFQTRLFTRRPGVLYEGAIHEQIVPSIERTGGTIESADVTIVHHGYRSDAVQGGQSRARRNLAMLKAEVERTPENALLHFHLGSTQQALGDRSSAKNSLERAAELDRGTLPKVTRVDLSVRLAQLSLAEGNDERAAAHARDCLAHDSGNVIALHVLGVSLASRGKLDEAVSAFTRLRACPSLEPTTSRTVDQLLAAFGGRRSA